MRVNSDRLLSELASSILKAENDLVVADTRRLLTTGKSSYLQGEFDRAETSLLQARSRWATTNTTAEVEVEYWLKLVQTALSVKTGRDIPVTAPLFPEMSQLISLAKRYYEDGTSLLARRDKTGAVKSFAAARQKISEIKVIFPLNQEARVLELKIDQLSDPDEFSRKFARMFAEAKGKIDARIDLTTAYSDLKDLEAINPRYSGLRTQIERAEILLGFRQPPPDPRAVAEARSLVQAAQRIFDSGQVSQFSFARTQLERAITLDPNNENASRLKDRIATYIGGDTAIVLPSAAEILYNEAVTFFTGGDYINSRARLSRLVSLFARGGSVQKVADLDARLTAIGY
jgi:tetratricopeptide (TPR) repeat protein